jgi:hypothetical protein
MRLSTKKEKKVITDGVTGFSELQPCGNCPYRRDAPLQYWDVKEFGDLCNNDRDKVGKVYGCHKADGSVCRGWLLDQRKRDYPSLALRVTLSNNKVSPEYLSGLNSPSPLFYSISEMCSTNYPDRFTLIKLYSEIIWNDCSEVKPDHAALVGVTQHNGSGFISETEYAERFFIARYDSIKDRYLVDNGIGDHPTPVAGIQFWFEIPTIDHPAWKAVGKQRPFSEDNMIIMTTMKKGRRGSLEDSHPPVKIGHYNLLKKSFLAMSGPSQDFRTKPWPFVKHFMYLPKQPIRIQKK